MAYDISKLIEIAKAEVGYCEKKSNASLDSKTANAGSGNYTKYWRDMAPSYQGQPWCDAFVDWCFVQAYGKTAAQALECGGCGNYYTPSSAACYKSKNQWHTSPKVGDQIFFRNDSRIYHTGIVVAVSGSTVTTIEGNTSAGSNTVVANGGCVARKTYSISNSRIAGYGRPNYGTQPKGGDRIMIEVVSVSKSTKNKSVVYFLRSILRGRGMHGVKGQLISLGFNADDDCIHAINEYQAARRKQGVELGTNGRNDSCCGPKMWNDITGGLVK